ncbi:MAG: hypothetical protein LBM61_02105 [Prevotellaceae bacterium]|nr:hypothetical protein [Prevotellaceae bacterium]
MKRLLSKITGKLMPYVGAGVFSAFLSIHSLSAMPIGQDPPDDHSVEYEWRYINGTWVLVRRTMISPEATTYMWADGILYLNGLPVNRTITVRISNDSGVTMYEANVSAMINISIAVGYLASGTYGLTLQDAFGSSLSGEFTVE